MINATRIAAGVAALALTVSLAYVVLPGTEEPLPPGAQTPDIDPTAFAGFIGTVICDGSGSGSITTTDWGSLTEGETYPRCTHESSDPRISGNGYSVHDYFKYDGVSVYGPRAVSSVIINDGGTWVGEQEWGYQRPADGAMRYTHLYRGTGDYEGLTALMILSQDAWGPYFDVEGVIFPGDLPPSPQAPIQAALDTWEQLAAD